MKRILVLVLLLFLFACNNQISVPQENQTTVDDVKTGAQLGDLVEINYVLTLENGTVGSTNNEELAKEHGLKNYVKGPFKFILGQSGIVTGFDTVIVGMAAGEHREATIEPSEAEVVIPLNRTVIENRFLTIPIFQKFPTSSYKRTFNKEPIIGDAVYNSTLQFKYQVINKTNTTVLAKMIVKEGEEYVLNNAEWPSQILKVTNEDVLFVQKPKDNQTIQTQFGTAQVFVSKSKLAIRHNPELNKIFERSVKIKGDFGINQQFQVTEIHEDYFVIKRYGLLSDKRLHLSVDMLNITAESVKDVDKSTPIPFISSDSGQGN